MTNTYSILSDALFRADNGVTTETVSYALRHTRGAYADREWAYAVSEYYSWPYAQAYSLVQKARAENSMLDFT